MIYRARWKAAEIISPRFTARPVDRLADFLSDLLFIALLSGNAVPMLLATPLSSIES